MDDGSDGREGALAGHEVDDIAELFESPQSLRSAAPCPAGARRPRMRTIDEATGEPRELYCYAISAKRYALYNLEDGRAGDSQVLSARPRAPAQPEGPGQAR